MRFNDYNLLDFEWKFTKFVVIYGKEYMKELEAVFNKLTVHGCDFVVCFTEVLLKINIEIFDFL